MEQNSPHKNALIVQLREAYGRVVYTYTAHHKLRERLDNRNKQIKITQIILSAVSTFGFIGTLVTNNIIATWTAGIFAAALLTINLFFKDFNLSAQITQHRNAADELWIIREKYVSLLTDSPVLSEAEIATRRDELQNKTYEIYKQSPETDSKSYKATQNALKNEEEQFFSAEEIDRMLPSHLRTDQDKQNNMND
jgi:hypothetical protein